MLSWQKPLTSTPPYETAKRIHLVLQVSKLEPLQGVATHPATHHRLNIDGCQCRKKILTQNIHKLYINGCQNSRMCVCGTADVFYLSRCLSGLSGHPSKVQITSFFQATRTLSDHWFEYPDWICLCQTRKNLWLFPVPEDVINSVSRVRST